MSKVCVVISVLALLLVGECCWADYVYGVTFKTYGTLGTGSKAAFESRSWATDGNDGELPLTQIEPYYVSIYKTAGVDGWNGPSGFYWEDWRPALLAGQSAVDDIYVWAETTTPRQDIQLMGGPWTIDPGVTYRLSLVSVPSGVTYTGPTEWGGVDWSTIILPFYSTDNGLTGYHFRVELTAIPEPSPLFALAFGLLPVGAAAMRRRRR